MLWAVVMAGGAGTRFWPESREKNPKQFITLFGKNSLFEETLHRIAPVIPKSRVIVVTQKTYAKKIQKLAGISAGQIIGEPIGRNTAPCVALAAARILKKDPNAVLAILPSDHKIGKPVLFQKILRAAGATADKTGMPVTFGIQPEFPHTGYGYLEIGEPLTPTLSPVGRGQGEGKVFKLKQFHEKPDLKKAKRFLASGKFLWNSGMFIWRADKLMEATKRYLPEVAKQVSEIGSSEPRLQKLYSKMPNISIDFGLMEKMKGRILTIPASVDWCDLGGWLALKEVWPADKDGNIARGNVLAVESQGNVVKAGTKMIALLGVNNFVVVDSGDAILICPKEKSEAIRQVVAVLREKKLFKYL